ncbi:hypothetical protein ACOI1H_16165 [Loktanella sp. DJP18]|uniref:hypothetical protein n=1 Tax=Loktanella sp. DJP18 TaxID=3409788 RepID=UPI003BB60222
MPKKMEVAFGDRFHCRAWVKGACYWEVMTQAVPIQVHEISHRGSSRLTDTLVLRDGEYTAVPGGSALWLSEVGGGMKEAQAYFAEDGELHGPVRYRIDLLGCLAHMRPRTSLLHGCAWLDFSDPNFTCDPSQEQIL